MGALTSISGHELRRYPSPTAGPFRRLAAEVHGLSPDNVVATNGGDELLRLAITTFVEPGRPIGTAEPSYSLYPVLAAVQGCPVHTAPLDDEWNLPDDFAAQMNDAGVQLTFIVNPHAPSGHLTPVDRLAEIAEQLDGVLCIDEAYVDFVDPALGYDTTALLSRFDNVLILRSMSKGYSLAGLRFGYGLAGESLIEPMQTKTKDSYNTDVISQALATAALNHRDEAAKTWAEVRRERDHVASELMTLGMICPPSQSNFLLAQVLDNDKGITARGLYQSLKSEKILVRYFDQPRLDDKLRITIGTPSDNKVLLAALHCIEH
jgi:histidinol-phosphate aminotransferase